jgi:hypothetical protein
LAIFALACAAAGPGTSTARADIVVDSVDDQQIPDPHDNYTFHCGLTFSTNIINGSYCTIYDIPGLSPTNGMVTVPNANWTFSIQLTGITPPGLPTPPPDSPIVYNLTYKYIGATTISVPEGQFEIDLGLFQLKNVSNSLPVPPFLYWSSYSFNGNMFVGTTGTAPVRLTGAPEPSAWALLALGMPLAGFGLRRARARSSRKGLGASESRAHGSG